MLIYLQIIEIVDFSSFWYYWAGYLHEQEAHGLNLELFDVKSRFGILLRSKIPKLVVKSRHKFRDFTT